MIPNVIYTIISHRRPQSASRLAAKSLHHDRKFFEETLQYEIRSTTRNIMPISKERISSPLEAGPSLLDASLIPPQLTSALEYVSSRLARKRLHLSLIVIRKDIKIPTQPSPQTPPARTPSPVHSVSTSPAKLLFGTSTFSLPSNLKDRNSSPTPSLASSQSSSGSESPASPVQTPNPYGITLMHASTLTEKAEKILRRTVYKAEKKFSIG